MPTLVYSAALPLQPAGGGGGPVCAICLAELEPGKRVRGAAQVQPRLPRAMRRPVSASAVHVPDVQAATVRRAAEGRRRRRGAAGAGVPRAAPAGKHSHAV
uniref:Uncharacterized protein n=1 Tax=Arundo donax TaxID=35708 RepID=A0A0A9A4E4_ARUDO